MPECISISGFISFRFGVGALRRDAPALFYITRKIKKGWGITIFLFSLSDTEGVLNESKKMAFPLPSHSS